MEWEAIFCTLCFAVTVSAQTTASPDELRFCQPNLKGYKFENTATERCYEFVYEEADRRSWSDARDYCQINGGRLINIEDKTKQLSLESFMDLSDNTYKPNRDTYDPTEKETWGDYDPNVWIGAMRDSDGSTWRFDQYQTSRTVRSVIVNWFNYGNNMKLIKEQNADKNRYTTDTCLFMRFNWKQRGDTYHAVYPWYQHQLCSSSKGHKHPFICEYEGYEYRQKDPASNWLIVIAVLGVFVSCGFLACTIYCLWDKIHTSYNVLQV